MWTYKEERVSSNVRRSGAELDYMSWVGTTSARLTDELSDANSEDMASVRVQGPEPNKQQNSARSRQTSRHTLFTSVWEILSWSRELSQSPMFR